MTERSTTPEQPDNERPARSIVLADNDVLLLEAIGEILRDKGYAVHLARDGLEALEAIRKLKPNYVILDIMMPKIDGSRVCWLIRQDAHLRDTPIIAFSGLGPREIRRFPELSADAYVAKGPLATVANNLLLAIRYLEERGRGDFEGGIFGFEGFRPRQLLGEMLHLKRHWEMLMRNLDRGVLDLDSDGRILMANAAASEILGKKEIYLIAEPLPSLFAPRDRHVIRAKLKELKRAHVPKECQMILPVRGREVSLRFSSIVEEGQCTAILVILEPRQAEAPAPK